MLNDKEKKAYAAVKVLAFKNKVRKEVINIDRDEILSGMFDKEKNVRLLYLGIDKFIERQLEKLDALTLEEHKKD